MDDEEYTNTLKARNWQASRRIRELEDKITALEVQLAARRWISVEDRLPKANASYRYFVFVEMGTTPKKKYVDIAEFSLGEFYLVGDYELYYGDKVTHWQELEFPAPPQSD